MLDNQVSEDGRTAFFVSPDPESHAERPIELYARETLADGSHRSVLVSRDLLRPKAEGLPAGAPDGTVAGIGGFTDGGGNATPSYAYASPDGSHVFFESTDRLTADAPGDTSVKVYEFDLDTNALTYLPGVADVPSAGACVKYLCRTEAVDIFTSSRDGSNFMFLRKNKVYFWREGQVTEIGPGERASAVRATPDGSEYVLQTRSFTEMGFNGGGHMQVYLYESRSGKVSCLSCPPRGVKPSGDAQLTHASEAYSTRLITDTHGISEDGRRVFFDSPDPLVHQDTNGVRDVYEWEGGRIYLLSTGVAKEPSFLGDNSPSGDDVFFSTSEGLVPGDTDGSYDVYDARVPRPGDQLPPSGVPCEGAVCQGPPSVPQLFAPPGSETFNGAANPAPVSPAGVAPKSLSRKQKLARALKACRRVHNKSRRTKCERKARRSYGKAAADRRRAGATSHNRGRGK